VDRRNISGPNEHKMLFAFYLLFCTILHTYTLAMQTRQWTVRVGVASSQLPAGAPSGG